MSSIQCAAILIVVALFSVCAVETTSAQVSRFDKVREWSDASGKFKKQARIVSASTTEVVLEITDGEIVTIPLKGLSATDQEFAIAFRERIFSDLKKQSGNSLFASEALRLFRAFETKGYVDSDNRKFVEAKIAELEKQSAVDAVLLPDGYLPKGEIPAKKESSKQLVDQWFKKSTLKRLEGGQKLLREAIQSDPTSLDAAIVLAMYYEIYELDSAAAQRYLNAAVKRGTRYAPISLDSDKTNLLAAMNNLAVSYATNQQVAKAKRIWEQANEASEGELPIAAKHNIARTNRMINVEARAGLNSTKSIRKSFGEFAEGVSALENEIGGWQLMFSVDTGGDIRNELEFLLSDKNLQQISESVIQNKRCVKCAGTSYLRCQSKLCTNGKVKKEVIVNRTLTTTDGTVKNIGRGVRIDLVDCPICTGTSKVDCPCCEGGIQD